MVETEGARKGSVGAARRGSKADEPDHVLDEGVTGDPSLENEGDHAVESRRDSKISKGDHIELSEEVEQQYFMEVKNAFAITMFCLDKQYECRAADFLKPLFHVFGKEGGDYCVLTLPHTECESPLMPHFTHVEASVSSTFPHSLYVLHRDALLAPPTVRYATAADTAAIEELVTGMGEENSSTVTAILDATSKIGQEGNQQIL